GAAVGQAPALRARAVGTGSASASPIVGRWSPVRRWTIAVSSCSRSAMPARTSAPNAPSPAPSSRSPSARLAPIPAGVRLSAAACARRATYAPAARPTPSQNSRFMRRASGGEGGGANARTAEGGGEQRGEHGHVARDRARAGGDAVDAVELGVDLAQGDL